MKYVVADDHFSVHMAISAILEGRYHVPPEDIVVMGNGDSLLDLFQGGGFSNALVILDLSMPGRFKRMRLVDALLTLEPSLLIVVYTVYTSAHLAHDLLQRGVKAFVTKTVSKEPLYRGITAALNNETYVDPSVDLAGLEDDPWTKLTPSQKAFVIDVCRDLSNDEIAKLHGVTTTTVSAHKRKAMSRLGISKDSLLSGYLHDHGLTYLLDE